MKDRRKSVNPKHREPVWWWVLVFFFAGLSIYAGIVMPS